MLSPTINTYNLYGDIYDGETIEFWNNFPVSTVENFTKNLPGKKILDLGSGPGRDALLLKDSGLEVICLDASEKMIEKTTNLGFKSIHKNFRDMNFPANSFDGVWAFTSLLHIPKNEVTNVLTNIKNILNDSGILLVGMMEGTYEGNKERDSMPNTYRYFKYYGEQELKDLITSAGFNLLYQERYQPKSSTYISQIYTKQ